MRRFAFLALSLMPVAALATDITLNHIGRLTGAGDEPVQTTVPLDMTFAIFTEATPAEDPEANWEETYPVAVVNGIYSVDIGARAGGGQALPSTLFPAGSPRWLQVRIDGKVLLPRLRVNVVPIAAMSLGLECEGCVTTPKVGDAAITGAKLATASIAFAHLAPDALGTTDTTVSRGDHRHDADYLPLGATLACAPGDRVTGVDATTGDVVCAPGFTAADAVTAMGTKSNTNPLHHDRFAPAEAVSSMGAKANTNPLHHDRYTNAEALAALGGKANTNPLHHDRYTNAEAVAAMGTKADANPLVHNRYADEEARVASGANLVRGWQMEDAAGWDDAPDTVLDTLPDGRQARVHRSVENGTSCYNWAETKAFVINPAKTYEFSIWIRSTEGDLNNYFGFWPDDASGNRIAGAWGNPYFRGGQGDPNAWVRWSGYLVPAESTDTNSDGVADVQVNRTNGTDWRWPPNAATARMRFGSCYGDGSNTGNTFFAMPSVREVDATTPLTSARWLAPTFASGWSNYGNVYNPAGYYLDAEGFVHLRGLVQGGSGTLFTLPPGYRPEYRELHVVSASEAVGRVDILPDGRVEKVTGPANGWIALDGYIFRAAQFE